MKVAWITDPHLDWLDDQARTQFYDSVAATDADALLIGGDIGLAGSVTADLEEFERALQRPIYFVLGNHDFYGGSIAATRAAVARLAASSQWLRYLSVSDPVALTSSCVLIGHDGWADARLGDFFGSPVSLNDYFLIHELEGLGKRRLFAKLNSLGDEAAEFLARQARRCVIGYPRMLVLTHVPPFRDACWHEGRVSNDLYLPHFACGIVGERLVEVMRAHPQCSTTVLCGHTHGAGLAHILPNLTVHTGEAVYGRPVVNRVLEIGE